MEQTVNTVSAICLYDTAILAPGMLLDNRAIVAEESAGLDECNGLFETFAGGFDDADIVWILSGGITNIVGLIEVAMVTAMVEGNVDVENIAINQDAGIRDTVADDFIEGCADGFWEIIIVEW